MTDIPCCNVGLTNSLHIFVLTLVRKSARTSVSLARLHKVLKFMLFLGKDRSEACCYILLHPFDWEHPGVHRYSLGLLHRIT